MSIVTQPARTGLPVTISAGGGAARGFVVDTEKISWRTIPPTREGTDQGAGASERSLTNDAVWRRSRDNWILGAGQANADLIDESSPLRFLSSVGIDPWTQRQLTPLRATQLARSSSATNLQLASTSVSGTPYLVLAAGPDVHYSSNPGVATPTWTPFTTGLINNVTSLTTDGRRIWFTDNSTIWSATPGTPSVTASSAYNAWMVGYANGRLLASSYSPFNELVEVHADGSTSPVLTHPNPDFVWTGVYSSPGGIYATGDVGDRSEVYVVTAIDATGALDVPFIAGDFPQGELVRSMASYAGVMIVATSRGVRLGLIGGGGFLSYGPLIDEPGDVRCLEPQGEYCWFGWTQTPSINGLGRLGLGRFTEELVPAFTTDLTAAGTVSGAVTSVASVAGLRYFAIAGRGVYAESTTAYNTISTMELGTFTYGIAEEMALDSITVWFDSLPASCSVTATVYNGADSATLLTASTAVAGATKVTAAYSGTIRTDALRVTLGIIQVGTTPVRIRRVTLRAAPKPFISEELTLPLLLSTAVNPDGMQEMGQDPYEEWTVLHNLLVSRARCRVSIGTHRFDARVDALQVEAGGLGGGNGLDGWADDLRWLEGTWDVTLTTLEPAT